MSDKQEVSQTENGPLEVRSAPKGGFVGNLKRFWWAYLLGLIVLIAVAVIVIIFAIVPAIAQSKMNKAKLEVQGLNMLNSEPNKFLFEVNSTITTDGSIHANIDPFIGSMYLEDLPGHTPFLKINFPATTADKHQIVNISQEVTIDNPEAFATFNTWFFNNETVRVTISGKTKAQPKGLSKKYSVDFKKTLTMKGLNLFKGTQVKDGEILILPEDDGTNFKATAEIPNASYFTLDIGNATFTNFIDDTSIGQLTIQNLIVRPGMNTVPVTANLNQSSVVTLVMSPAYCKTGVVPVKLLGADAVNNGQKLPYFVAALGSANQTVTMDIGSMIAKSLNTTVTC